MDIILIIFILLATIAALGVVLWSSGSKKRRPPTGLKFPPVIGDSIPFLGCLPAIIRQGGLSAFLFDAWRKNGEVFTLRILGFNLTMLTEVEGVAAFFSYEEEQFNFAEGQRMFLEPMMGKEMVSRAIPIAPYILNAARRCLNSNIIRSSFSSLRAEIETFILKAWPNEGTADVSKVFHSCLTQSICSLMFAMDTTELNHLYSQLEDGLGLVAVFAPWLPTAANRARLVARDRLIQIIEGVIAARRANADSSAKYSDLLQVLSDTRLPDGSLLPTELIPFGIINVLLAATTSTPVVAAWTLSYLLQDPALLNDIIQEQKEIVTARPAGGEMTIEETRKMDRVHWCIKESLRFTSATFVQRRVMEDVSFKEWVIPKGDYVCVSPHLVHFDPKRWTKPEKYDPYRFSPQRDEGKGLEFFLGFGRGRHQCAGESIAYLQEKILFSTLFRFYDLQLVAAVPPPNPNQPLAVLRPMQPILVKYKRLATPRY